jgi:hypothetical protein
LPVPFKAARDALVPRNDELVPGARRRAIASRHAA